MSNIYFIADTHFNEPEVFRMSGEYKNFYNCAAKDRSMVENWNKTVKPDDIVYILGDFGDPQYAEKLNGKKYLIQGNHDIYGKSGFFEKEYDVPILFKNFFILSHEPQYIPDTNSPFACIFGHVHNNPMYRTVSPRTFCVSACRIGYTPISYIEIVERMRKEEENEC